MNRTISFVSLFRNTRKNETTGKNEISWGASFKVDGTDIGATHLPAFDLSLFATKLSQDGKTRYLGSKRPLVVEYSDIRAGKKAGKFFTNIAAIYEQPEADANALDRLLAGDAEAAAPVTDEPANTASDDEDEVTEF